MGGYFSTRWNWESTRADTDGLLRLDVRSLNRAGALRPGAVSTTSWIRGDGETTGNIVTHMNRDGDCLTLDYKTRTSRETDWTPYKEAIWLDTTPCHFGGHRAWFRCPGCQRRRAVLFNAGGLFRCRECHDLAYSSTRETDTDRSIRRCAALQKRLGGGGDGVPVWRVPPKPHGMHWETYERLARELGDHGRRALAGMIGEREALAARLDRMW